MSVHTGVFDMRERDEVKVACWKCGWSNDHRLVVVDRYLTDYPPIPRGEGSSFLELYRDNGCDPDDLNPDCDHCGEQLDALVVVEAKGIIYGFVNHEWGGRGDVAVVGMDDEGDVLASHICSSPAWGPHDIGVTSDWKHDKYAERYPQGFFVFWVADPGAHKRCFAAIQRGNKRVDQQKKEEEQQHA